MPCLWAIDCCNRNRNNHKENNSWRRHRGRRVRSRVGEPICPPHGTKVYAIKHERIRSSLLASRNPCEWVTNGDPTGSWVRWGPKSKRGGASHADGVAGQDQCRRHGHGTHRGHMAWGCRADWVCQSLTCQVVCVRPYRRSTTSPTSVRTRSRIRPSMSTCASTLSAPAASSIDMLTVTQVNLAARIASSRAPRLSRS